MTVDISIIKDRKGGSVGVFKGPCWLRRDDKFLLLNFYYYLFHYLSFLIS